MANKDIKKGALNDYDLQGVTGGTKHLIQKTNLDSLVNLSHISMKYGGPQFFKPKPLSKREAADLLHGFNENAKVSDIVDSCDTKLSSMLDSLNPNMTVNQAINFLSKS